MPLQSTASPVSLCKEIFYYIFCYTKQLTCPSQRKQKGYRKVRVYQHNKNIRGSCPEVFSIKGNLQSNFFGITLRHQWFPKNLMHNCGNPFQKNIFCFYNMTPSIVQNKVNFNFHDEELSKKNVVFLTSLNLLLVKEHLF